ncbi:MAG: lactate utilization protein C [Pseudomonadota bacterium]
MSATHLSENQRARSAIFKRLREMPVSPLPAPDVQTYFRTQPTVLAQSSANRIERFITQAKSWRTEIIEATPGTWQEYIAEVAQKKSLQRLLAGRGTAFSDGLNRALSNKLSWYDEDLSEIKPILFSETDAGITTVRSGVAETGSLIVWPTHNEPRSLSLVPPVHIAILYASDIVETLYEAVSTQDWASGMPTNALLISGPSRTSDIQRTLAYGAHGPKELVLILIRDDVAAAQVRA